MKPYLLLAVTVLASPPTIAGGFLDIGHLDWGAFLVGGYNSVPVPPPKPATTGLVPADAPAARTNADQPASAEAPNPTSNSSSTTGAPRQITPGVSP